MIASSVCITYISSCISFRYTDILAFLICSILFLWFSSLSQRAIFIFTSDIRSFNSLIFISLLININCMIFVLLFIILLAGIHIYSTSYSPIRKLSFLFISFLHLKGSFINNFIIVVPNLLDLFIMCWFCLFIILNLSQ